MTSITCIYENLREKLDTLGYGQTLPLSAVPLVHDLLDDLIKTTQSLRECKQEYSLLLEEKNCWELGVEPYKCDNARLLKELNQLHAQNLESIEKYEEKLNDCQNIIRTLQSDKDILLEQNQEMQHQLRNLSKQNSQSKLNIKSKKPFISTVRPDEKSLASVLDPTNSQGFRCTKCTIRQGSSCSDTKLKKSDSVEIKRLENTVADLRANLDIQKNKVEAREREIKRLSDLLVGGRPATALAKDCCYKEVAAMNDDITRLQLEKSEFIKMLDQYENKMHEAMQRSIDLSKKNQDLRKEMETLKTAALEVEDEANTELALQEKEIVKLKGEIKKLANKCKSLQQEVARGVDSNAGGDDGRDHQDVISSKELNDRLNEMSQTVLEQKQDIQKYILKIKKQKERIEKLEKEVKEYAETNAINLDEEKIRLKSERDFFQKEFLRMVSNTGSLKEVEFLQQQIKSKDEELKNLRNDLFSLQLNIKEKQPEECPNKQNSCAIPISSRSYTTVSSMGSNSTGKDVHSNGSATSLSNSARASECIQAAVLRAERERDCAQVEVQHLRFERDTLREKHLSLSQRHAEELEKLHLEKEKLLKKIKELEFKIDENVTKNYPNETQIILLREEIEEYKRQLHELQTDNSNLKLRYTQLKTIQEQTQKTLLDDQKRLAIAEEKLLMAEKRANTIDSTKETEKIETIRLKEEISSLKQTYLSMERDKDKLLNQLDAKTERAYQLEYELKLCKEQRKLYERQVKDLEDKLLNLKSQKRECDAELHETSSETTTLRQQITALQTSRDRAIAENARLSKELAERESEILSIKKKLSKSDAQIETLKTQLHQYVLEVKKAEDLLMEKEKQREEMLEHYRSLSHDAMALEDNKQSLEFEAVQNKCVISELETELATVQSQLKKSNQQIEQLEDQIAELNSKISSLEKELEKSKADQQLLEVDLKARRELCEKLDVEKTKLNAELNEFNDIRKKLQKENEILRTELKQVENDYKATSTALEDVLKETRKSLEDQLEIDGKLNQELLRLKQEKYELLNKLDEEQERRHYEENLAHEMQVQNQELRQNIVDDRFRQARSREASPRTNIL